MKKIISSGFILLLASANSLATRISFTCMMMLLLAHAPLSMAAITITSSGFNGVTDGAITTSGLLDWGYVSNTTNVGLFDGSYSNVLYDNLEDGSSNNLTTVSAASSIGAVTLSEGSSIDASSQDSNFTFDGNASAGAISGFAPGEDDIWTITFNDLGVGSRSISLYLGHSENDRIFDMDVSGTGLTSFTDTSAQIGTLGSTVASMGTSGSAVTYDIAFTTTSASDDLTLTFGGVSGSAGTGMFSGYTVAVPEPSTFVLMAISLVAVVGLRRRKK